MIRHDTQHETQHDNVASEPRDVPIRGILYFLLSLVLTIVGAMAFLVWVFDIFNAQVTRADVGLPPLASERRGPPAPRLQASPPLDLAALRAGEAKRLSSYGWISPQDDIIHIPIEKAKELVLEHGVPQWPVDTNYRSTEETAPPSQPAKQTPRSEASEAPAANESEASS